VTTPQQDFQAQRRVGIGGSDAAAIVGMDPWRTALDVYREKIGEAEERPVTPQMLRGRLLESVVVEEYARLTGKKVRRQPQRAHPDFPFIIANLDRQILADDHDGTGLLEVKCPNMHVFLRYTREGLPAHIVVQGQHYLGVTGYEWMSYAIFNADLWKLVHFEIKRDDAFIEGLFEREAMFWREYVEQRVPPPPVQITMPAPEGFELPPLGPDSIVQRDDQEWADAAENFRAARELRETAEGVEEQAKVRVKELMAEHRVVEGANLRVYNREVPGRKSFDKKALEANKPLDGILVAAAIVKWIEKYFAPTPAKELAVGALGTLFNVDLPQCRLELTAFDKVGKPFTEFRPYFLNPARDEEE
jgi:putative phage-type endonuclease